MSTASREPAGSLRAKQHEKLPLPRRGKVRTLILTSAQNNTGLHLECWRNLNALAEHTGAKIMVASFTYNKASMAAKGQKTSKEGAADEGEWWTPEVVPHLVDRSVEIAPGLVWCGDLQILPTAVNPLSGLESHTGRSSSIVPHVTFAVQSVASPKHQGCKFLYTTGTVTLRNYIQKKAGQKAEFHHGYGALIVEVRHDGTWFVRQLNADSEGVIYDLDRRAKNGRVTSGHRPEAIIWGDIHTRQLQADNEVLGWGAGGILDSLRPKRQVLHDILDFRSQNHHDRQDPWKTYAKHVAPQGLNVAAEIAEVARFLDGATRPWCETVVAAANHDEALIRWLKETDFRSDPQNALFYLQAHTHAYMAIRSGHEAFNPLKWALERIGAGKRVKFLRRDEDYTVCPDASGGIELGMHGDVGANGARGSLPQYAKTGRKCVVGHSHSAGLRQGAMQVGVMGALDQGYNQGQSSWSHTNALVYPNGKRTLLTIWRGRWRA